MNTLHSSPVKELLAQLFLDAQASNAQMAKDTAEMPREEIARRAKSGDYRGFYMQAKNYHLAVSSETGALLYMLARSSRAQSIVEFGTSLGISTLHLAAALKDNGGGRLIGSEFEPSKVARARATLSAAKLGDLVEIRDGDALESLARDLPESIDLVLLDGAKPLYLKILDLLLPKLKSGALVIADNADWCPEYLARVRQPDGAFMSVPFAGDVELSLKL